MTDQLPSSPREFLASAAGTATAAAAALAAGSLPAASAHAQTVSRAAPAGGLPAVTGTEHWTTKRVGSEGVRLFLWNKKLRYLADASGRASSRGTILFGVFTESSG